MQKESTENLLERIEELENRLAESEQLIEAIKAGEVDAFALYKDNMPEVFTLQSGDYAYRVLVENFNEGALNLSEDGLIVYTNTYFTQLLNLPYEKIIGSSFFQFVHPVSMETFRELFRKGLAGQSKGEINLVVGDVSYPVYASLTSLYPTLPTVGMIITDLSEKKEHERKIKEKNIELQKINKELEAFTYISSHDLQEPLRKIQAFAARIVETEKQQLSEKGQEYFRRMQDAATRMQTLIQDLLGFSRLASTDRKFEFTDLNLIIEDVKSELKEVIEETNAIVETFGMCKVNIIPFQFRQLMFNLIGNALKFSKPGIPPRILIKSTIVKGSELNNDRLLPQKKYCHVSVSDNGIGFEKHYAQRIFEVFQKLHSKDEYPGTGIGLAVVKKIVDNHNGIISAESELNKGATFDIYFPA